MEQHELVRQLTDVTQERDKWAAEINSLYNDPKVWKHNSLVEENAKLREALEWAIEQIGFSLVPADPVKLDEARALLKPEGK